MERPTDFDEALLQRLWFEEACLPELTTLDGERIKILQPGFWNHSHGPDFLQCCLVNGSGKRESGSVEIHIDPLDWDRHHHVEDAAYQDVILHIIWDEAPQKYYPKSPDGKCIRQVALKHQLRFPLAELRCLSRTSPIEQEVGAKCGACRSLWDAFSSRHAKRILAEAGWFRLRQKGNLWQSRQHLHGKDQALWIGLAESLGYSKNRESFITLAQRLPIEMLQKKKNAAEIEALLFGMAGFLPSRTLPEGTDHAWMRKLWEYWWKSDFTELRLPKEAWRFAAIRPANRPERRLAVLAILARNWAHFRKLADAGEPQAIIEFFQKITHDFWSFHTTLSSKPLPHRQTLLGEDRILSLLFNVIWPLSHLAEESISRWLPHCPKPIPNRKTKLASVRILPSHTSEPLNMNLIEHEGLLQIFQDFCGRDLAQCAECSFPKFLKSTGEQNAG